MMVILCTGLEEWEVIQKEEAEDQLRKLPTLPDDGVECFEKSGLLMVRMNEKENVSIILVQLLFAIKVFYSN